MKILRLAFAWLRTLVQRLRAFRHHDHERHDHARHDHERDHGGQAPSIPLEDLLPLAEQLRNIAYSSLAGDPASRPVGSHGRRNIGRSDSAGVSKAATHDASMHHEDPLWSAMAEDIQVLARTGPWPRSLRTPVPKGDGSARPIDDPPEIKRLAALFVRHVIGDRIDAALTPRQFGGRTRHSYAHHCRHVGATVQDHFATGIHHDIYGDHGKILVLDLTNAFGLLPRGAVLAGLCSIGLEEDAAGYVWHLAKINAQYATGEAVKGDPKWGIEQGNCLSAALMNLALAPLLRELEAELGVHAWAFLDDLYITMPATLDAAEVFRRFRKIAARHAFTNVRRLWREGDAGTSKNSRVVDTTLTPLRVLKTYDIDALGVSLAHEKVVEFGLIGPMSLNKIRRASRCQALTRQAMRARTGLSGRSEPKVGWEQSPPGGVTNPCGTEHGEIRREESPLGTRKGNPGGQLQGGANWPAEDAEQAGGHGDAHETASTTGIPRTGEVEAQQGPKEHTDGQPPIVPLGDTCSQRDRGFHNPGVGEVPHEGRPRRQSPGGEGEQPEEEVPPPAVDPFFPFDEPAIAEVLRAGRRVRIHDRAKGRVLVLAGLESALGVMTQEQLERALRSLLRAVRAERQVTVAYDPGEAWTASPTMLGRGDDPTYVLVGNVERPDGLVEATLRLREQSHPSPTVLRPRAVRGAEIVIEDVSCVCSARRLYAVTVSSRTAERRREVEVESAVMTIGKLEAIAIVAGSSCGSVAIPARGIAATLGLDGETVPAQVGLARARARLRSGHIWHRSGSWLIGAPRHGLRGSTRHSRSASGARP